MLTRPGWHRAPQGHWEYLDARGDRVSWLSAPDFEAFVCLWRAEYRARLAAGRHDP